MTTARVFSDSEGTFKASHPDHRNCPKCKRQGWVNYQIWQSSDGGYEDYRFNCMACGHVWWVDGADS